MSFGSTCSGGINSTPAEGSSGRASGAQRPECPLCHPCPGMTGNRRDSALPALIPVFFKQRLLSNQINRWLPPGARCTIPNHSSRLMEHFAICRAPNPNGIRAGETTGQVFRRGDSHRVRGKGDGFPPAGTGGRRASGLIMKNTKKFLWSFSKERLENLSEHVSFSISSTKV